MQRARTMRVDGMVLVAGGLCFGAATASAPLAASAAALGVAVVVARRVRPVVLLVAVAAFGASAWRAHHALAGYEARRIAARDQLGAPARCAGQGRIVVSPAWGQGVLRYRAELGGLDCEGRRVSGPVRVRLYGGPVDLRRGDRISVVAQLAPARLFRNPEASDPTPFAARRGSVLSGAALSVEVLEPGRGLGAWIDRARAHARARIDRTFAPVVAPMARALVLGENDLDPEDDEAFRKSGLSHMLAVSGTHLVFAVVALVQALAFVLVRIERLAARFDVMRLAAAGGAALALLYADFAGGSGSAWRAAFMLSAAFLVRALGRRPRPARVFAASLLVGALVEPLVAYDVSFLLSAAATSGLIVLGQPLAARCEGWRSRPLRFVALSLIATATSMLPCAPLLAILATDLTFAGLLANVVAAPFGEAVALPLCLAHALLAPVPALEHGVALVGSGALLVVKRVAHASAAATWLAFPVPAPDPWHLALLLVGAAGVLSRRHRAWRAAWVLATLLAVGGVEVACRAAGQPRGQLRVSVLDVGQGDATLVDLPDGRLLLIDGGGFVGSPVDPGKSVILPMLRARRRRRVDIVVLSHPHPDHFTGLATALEGVEVGELWDSGQGEAEGAGPVYAAMLARLRERGVPILRPADLCGRAQRFGGARLEVLGPCPRFTPGRDANDNSLVLRIAYGKRVVLLTGDAEAHQEAQLLRQHAGRLRADLLKVGHHGSRTSSSAAFLSAVRPTVATVSCGVRNRFGHPHPKTMSTLNAAGVAPLRIDRVGGVIWRSDGKSVQVRAFSGPL